MKHRIGYNRLGRREAHRTAMKNNMVTSLFRYERVETTKAKALEVKRTAEKLVTRARVDSVHNRRIVAERIHDSEIVAKLFTEIAPRYLERPGGYTRVLKTGFRQGDAAQMVILELVDRKIEEKVRPQKEAAQETEVVETAAEETSSKSSTPASKKSSKPKADETESTEETVEAGESEVVEAEVVEDKAEAPEEEEKPAEAAAETPVEEATAAEADDAPAAEAEAPQEAEAAPEPKDEAAPEADEAPEDTEKKE